MVIEFQPAAPTGVNAASSYGAAQQSAQDMPVTANLYEAQARLSQQSQLAGMEAQQQSSRAATAAQLDARHQDQAFAGQQDQTALGYAALQQHSADIDRHAEAQAWVQKQDLTYADQLRMQRMQQAVSEVETDFQQNKIDPETRTAMLLNIKTGLDPLKMKFEQQQAAHLQQQDKLTDMQIQRQAAHDATAREFEAKMMTGGQEWAWFPDDNGKRHPLVKNPKDGTWYNPLLSNGGKAAADDAKQQQADTKLTTDAVTDYGKKLQQAVANTQRYMDSLRTPEGQKRLGGQPVPSWADALEQSKKELGVHVPAEQYVEGYRKLHGKPAGGQAARGGDIGGGGDYGPPPPPPAPAPTPEQIEARRQQVVREQPPITDPEKTTDRQKEVLDLLGKKKAAAETIRLPGGENEQAKRAIGEVEDLYRRYGSLEGMPPPARQHVAAVMQMIDRLDQQLAAGAKARDKFVADQGTRFDRGLKRIADAVPEGYGQQLDSISSFR